jgi:hypothetical protein
MQDCKVRRRRLGLLIAVSTHALLASPAAAQFRIPKLSPSAAEGAAAREAIVGEAAVGEAAAARAAKNGHVPSKGGAKPKSFRPAPGEPQVPPESHVPPEARAPAKRGPDLSGLLDVVTNFFSAKLPEYFSNAIHWTQAKVSQAKGLSRAPGASEGAGISQDAAVSQDSAVSQGAAVSQDAGISPEARALQEAQATIEESRKSLADFLKTNASPPSPPPPPSASEAELASPYTHEMVRDARRALTDIDRIRWPERTAGAAAKVSANVTVPRAAREQPIQAFEDELKLKAARDAAFANAKAPLVVLKKRSARTYQQISAALAQSITSVRVLHALPRTTAEAERLHPGVGKYFPATYWSDIAARFAATGATVSTSDAASFGNAAQQLARLAEIAPPSELVVLVGQVDADGMMTLPDGSSIAVADLSKNARAPIIFLGCNTSHHIEVGAAPAHVANAVGGVGSYVSYNDAVKMVASIASEVKTQRNASLWTLFRSFQDSPVLKTLIVVV